MENPRFLPSELTAKEKVGVHEHAHAAAAAYVGATVLSITAEPNGAVRGQTEVKVNSGNGHDQLLDFLTILEASTIGEEICGIYDHAGCGHDHATANVLEQLAAQQVGVTTADLLRREAKSRARAAVLYVGRKRLIEGGIALANEPKTLQKP